MPRPCNTELQQLESLLDRYWANVDKRGANQCWEWLGSRLPKGYGTIHDGRSRKRVGAHRIAYELQHGTIPAEMMVRHTCDTPWCVNPKHLVLGTAKNNSEDMCKRGRSLVGERNVNAKLTAVKVRQIRKECLRKPQRKVAKAFGVSEATVSGIVNGTRWAEVR